MAQKLKTDNVLFYTIICMVFFGLVILYSASAFMAEVRYQWNLYFIVRQLGWALVSVLVMLLLKKKDYRIFNKHAWAFASTGVVVFLLLVVYFVDSASHRWLRLGAFNLQPSEFAKPALILFLAFFVSWRAKAINDRHTLGAVALMLSLLAGAVMVADLGTAIVLVGTAAAVFWVAGLEWRYCLMAAGIVLLGVMIAVVARPYRLARIIGRFDPDYTLLDTIDTKGYIKNYIRNNSGATRDPSYQARQSKIAVGSGGATGLGLMEGKQKLLFLPAAHTDFIYAVVGEELGLWGCLLVLTAFLIILYRGLRLFWIAPDDFGRYLALGVVASVVLQAMINMSVVLDMGPTKGLPLPMVSHGGSSLLSTLTSLGMLLSVSDHAG